MLSYIVWDVSPEIIRIGNFSLRWYGLLFAFAFIFAYIVLTRLFKKENIPVALLDKLTLYVGVGTIIGARLGHCLFYEPKSYLSNPLDILKIWEGGLASHGAAIGILIAIYLFCRKTQKPFLWILDKLVIVVASAGFFIRMGNLMNSEIYGYPTSLPWAFVFVSDGSPPSHPTQIYEALAYIILFFVLYKLYNKTKDRFEPGLVFGAFLVLLFGIRFWLEFYKQPQVEAEADWFLNLGQWLSIPFVLLGTYFLMKRKKKLPEKQDIE